MAIPDPFPPANATSDQLAEFERNRWNHYLLDATWRSTRFNVAPNTLLMETAQRYPASTALDVNMGEGRNALYLAQQGWQVTGVDIADQALAFAQQRAQELGVQLTTIGQNTDAFDWGVSQWDLIVLCYADEGMHVAKVQQALKPGGLLVFENFHTDINLLRGNDTSKPIGFASNALKVNYATAGFNILHYAEPIGVADFSRETHRLVQLVAQKPLTPAQ